MTLAETIKMIEVVASKQPSVNMIVRNDVFRLNTIPTAKYGVFAWTQQQHTAPADGDTLRVSLTLYYVDRLNEDASNRLEVQSMAVQVLTNIIRGLSGRGVWQTGDAALRTFDQKFLDVCAGAFATLTLAAPYDTLCNTTYDGERSVEII